MKHAQELGDTEQEYSHAFALDPPPSVEHIRGAVQRLHDPERRIVEEFFWFWPAEWGKGKHDPALVALSNGDKDSAFKTWSEGLADDHAPASVVSKHNLAVMYQLVALDSEHVALDNDLSQEQLARISKYWRTCFKWWEELTGDEVFWSLVTDRIRMLDDKQLTTGFARRMRMTLPEAMDKINAMLAIQYIERDKLDFAANHITYMKETHQGLDDVAKILGHVTKPLRTRVKSAVDKAMATAAHNPASADKAAFDLLSTAKEPLHIIELIFPENDQEGLDICDSVASACLNCANSFSRETERWDVGLDILQKAEVFARADELKAEIAGAVSEAYARKELSHPAVKTVIALLQRIESLERLAKIKEIYRTAPNDLYSVEMACGKTSKAYEFCSDAVASSLRNIAVDLHNAVGESTKPAIGIKLLVLSLEIHDRAVSLACGQELKTRFREDDAALNDFRTSLSNQGVRDSIRRDLIREGLLPLWGGQTAPPPVQPQHRREAVGKRTAGRAEGQRPPPVPADFRREHVGAESSGAGGGRQVPTSKANGSKAAGLIAGAIGLGLFILFIISQSNNDSNNSSGYSSSSVRPSTYTPPPPAFNQPVQALPRNGWIQRYHSSEAVAPLQIVTRSSGENYFVKIEDFYSGRLVATVFVRGGNSTDLDVPLGSYKLKYATGSTWYGTEYLFGPDTSYSKADERFDFKVIGNQVSGYTVELYLQRNGNLSTSQISASEF